MTSRCLDPSELDAFVSGLSLTEEDRARFEAHIDECPTCAGLVAELARIYGSENVRPRSGPIAAPTPNATIGFAATIPSSPPGAKASFTPSLGRYQLGERLGEGGMGVVFAAHRGRAPREG